MFSQGTFLNGMYRNTSKNVLYEQGYRIYHLIQKQPNQTHQGRNSYIKNKFEIIIKEVRVDVDSTDLI
jgi:hypothetical protein